MTTELEGGDALKTDPDGVVIDDSGIHTIPVEEVTKDERIFSPAIATAPFPLMTLKFTDDLQRIKSELAEVRAALEERDLADVIRESLADNTTTSAANVRKQEDEFIDLNAVDTQIISVRWDWENLTRLNPTEGKPFQDYPALIHAWERTKRQAKSDWQRFSRNKDAGLSPLEIQVFQEFQILIQYLLRVFEILKKREEDSTALRKIKVLEKQYRWGLQYIEKRKLHRSSTVKRVIYDPAEDKSVLLHPDLRSIVFSDSFNSLLEMVKELLAYDPNPSTKDFAMLTSMNNDEKIDVLLELVRGFVKTTGSLQLWWVHEKRKTPFPQFYAQEMARFFRLLGQRFI